MTEINYFNSPLYYYDTNRLPERYMKTLQTIMRVLLDGLD